MLHKQTNIIESQSKTAKSIGALFIITMILGMIDAYTVAPLLNTPLKNISPNETRILTGAFSILFMSIGVVGIAILFFPVLEKYNKFIAITYLCSRVMECMLLIAGVIVYFIILSLSQESISAGALNQPYYHSLSKLATEARFNCYQVAMIILSIASLMVCYVLYQSRLVPRLISIVGFLGYALVLLSAPLDLLGMIDTAGTGGIMYVPGALFELFLLPGWLIAKGFSSYKTFPEVP